MKLFRFTLLILLLASISYTPIRAEETLSIISSSPEDNTVNISVKVNPTLTFSNPLDPSTVNANSIQLRKYASSALDATKVPADILLSEDGTVVSIVPTDLLDYGKQYYLYADSGVRDVNGNQLPTANRWLHAQRASHEFTTELTSYVEGVGTVFNLNSYLETVAMQNGGTYTFTEAGSPYKFPGGFIIKNDIVLRAEPGARIEIGNRQSISIENGQLEFMGSEEKPIVITSESTFGNFIASSDIVGATPRVNLQNVQIENGENCFISQRNSINVLEDVTFGSCKTGQLVAFASTDLMVRNLKNAAVTAPSTGGLLRIGLTAQTQSAMPMKVSVFGTDFAQDGLHIIKISDQSGGTYDPAAVSVKVNESTFSGDVKDTLPFLIDHTNPDLTIDATENYWGTSEGPYVTGTTLKTNGPQVPASVKFQPFKTRDPATIKECCSSVLFIPGIQGSRLYAKDPTNDDGEDQLWEPNWRTDLTELGLDENGNSIRDDIYTRDIIERTNVGENYLLPNRDENIYKDSVNYFRSQKENGTISSFDVYAYDWRLDFDELINSGTKQQDGARRKLVEVLKKQASLSDTGKVTIVAHSMGGLLTKRFVQTLSEADQKFIENVVLIASPQIGTPQGALGVLHGIEFTDNRRFIMPQKFTRKLAEDMVTAHVLAPSDKYFEKVSVKPVTFKESIYNEISALAQYGSDIDNGEEMQSFIAGREGREDASFNNVNYPNISPNGLVAKAYNIHTAIDDYNFPADIKVVQIVGSGVPTIKKIEYTQNKNDEFGTTWPTYMQYQTLGGDGTVAYESASYMNVPTYFINLNKYNKDNNKNADHKNISGIQPVTDILTNVIKKESVTFNNYISESIGLSTAKSLFSIGMHSPVDIHLYDAEGRHTGPVYEVIDGEAVKFIEENIPNTVYQEYGEDKYISGINEENYTLELDGYAAGTFTLDIQKFNEENQTSYQSFINLPATEDLASVITMTPGQEIEEIILDTNGDSSPDIQAKKDGTVIDLNKTEENETPDDPADEPEGENPQEPRPVVPPAGAVPLALLQKVTPKVEDVPGKALPVIESLIAGKIPKPAISKPIAKPAIKNVKIDEPSELPKETALAPAKTNLMKLQLASVGNTSLGKRMNLVEFFRKIFRKR